jgi:hypothetical protein
VLFPVVMAPARGSVLADLRCCSRFSSMFCLRAAVRQAARESTRGFYSVILTYYCLIAVFKRLVVVYSVVSQVIVTTAKVN